MQGRAQKKMISMSGRAVDFFKITSYFTPSTTPKYSINQSLTKDDEAVLLVILFFVALNPFETHWIMLNHSGHQATVELVIVFNSVLLLHIITQSKT